MAHISMKVLSETINIDAVVEEARQAWGKRENKRRSLEKWLVRLIPIGLIIMAIVFYLLSAPHTAGIVNIITPGYGKLAPVAWELGILIISAVREAGWRNPLSKWLLWTLVAMSVVINIAGAFIAVVESGSGIATMNDDTLLELLGRYGGLPATYQVVLFLVIPIGAVIPLMAKAVGEILIKLAMGRIKLETESDEMKWLKERTRVVYGALFQAAIKEGAGAATAGNWAKAVAERMFREVVYEDVEATSQQWVNGPASLKTQPTMGFGAIAARSHLGQSQDSLGQSDLSYQGFENPAVSDNANSKDLNGQSIERLSKRDAIEWLQANSGLMDRHPRQLSRIYMQEKYGVESEAGYKTFERAKKDLGG